MLWVNYIAPFNEFEREANLAIPLLVQMDDATLLQFTAPAQTHEIERYYSNANTAITNNGYPRYGNSLSVTYKFGGSKEDIIKHYKQMLIQYGWNKRGTEPEITDLYYLKDTACFSLIMIDSDAYRIFIRHDFWKQEFSPKPSPNFPGTDLPLWNVMTLGETTVYTCP